MSRIYLMLAVFVSVVGLSACNRQAVNPVSLPDDVALVSIRFLTSVRAGDEVASEKFVSDNFLDDSRTQFANMSKLLKKSPLLIPAIYQPKPGILGPSNDEVSLTFAAKDNGQWVTSNVRLYRPTGGTFEVEYWDVKISKDPPATLAHVQQMQKITSLFMPGLAILALLGLGLLIWVVRRRTHIIAPEPVIETRRIAATVRDLNPDS